MKKFLGAIVFISILFASYSQTFLQHLRVNGIIDFTINNHTLKVNQSGPLLKGELLKEAKANGIEKVIYYVGLKDKVGYKIKIYKINKNKLVLTKTIYPFKIIRESSYSSSSKKHYYNYKICKDHLTPNNEYYLSVECKKLALAMVASMKLNPKKFNELGFHITKANNFREAIINMTPEENQYDYTFYDICLKTRAVFCKTEKPANVVLKAYLNSPK